MEAGEAEVEEAGGSTADAGQTGTRDAVAADLQLSSAM